MAPMAISLAAQMVHAILCVGCRGKPAGNQTPHVSGTFRTFQASPRASAAHIWQQSPAWQGTGSKGQAFNAPRRSNCSPCNSGIIPPIEGFVRPGCDPPDIGQWTRIPAVPSAAFKELDLTSLLPKDWLAVFYSSGTTGQKPSRHFHNAESLALYESSLWNGFKSRFGGAGELVFLTPDGSAAPHSSLIHMFEIVRQKYGLPVAALPERHFR